MAGHGYFAYLHSMRGLVVRFFDCLPADFSVDPMIFGFVAGCECDQNRKQKYDRLEGLHDLHEDFSDRAYITMVRFFRGLRREKVAPFGAVEVRPQGSVSVWGHSRKYA